MSNSYQKINRQYKLFSSFKEAYRVWSVSVFETPSNIRHWKKHIWRTCQILSVKLLSIVISINMLSPKQPHLDPFQTVPKKSQPLELLLALGSWVADSAQNTLFYMGEPWKSSTEGLHRMQQHQVHCDTSSMHYTCIFQPSF